MKKILRYLCIVLAIFLGIAFSYLFLGKAPEPKNILWGVNFSSEHAKNLGLDWKKAYLALLDDLKVKRIKLALRWDLAELEQGEYSFEDFDWQIEQASSRNLSIIPVIGMKTTRWPECHIPGWAQGLPKEVQQERILQLLQALVLRYKDVPAIRAWQIENEPFFPFGECPWTDKEFLKKEVALVKSLDPNRQILITDSGEGSFWTGSARYGDIVGTTMYRKVWVQQLNLYFTYPLPPVFYWRKAELISYFFGKEVIGAELQAEPWGPELLYFSSLAEQEKTMNAEQFTKNIEFAKKTGLKEHYLWGSEWWYWMKEKQKDPSIWNAAKSLFK
ncbi:MAG: hypothetical protein HYS60_01685 [Candidatus Wildermuthbacteria bacterium]|nr:hypothetical protein [Candidatus Wildermuthbacteria bacterium]